MFRYYIKLGMLGIRQNPILSALMVAAIAVGIGACMTIINIDYVMSGNPIPQRSEVLYHVQLDSWDPNEPAQEPNEPPNQVTYLDGTALLGAAEGRRQVLSYRSTRVVQPADPDVRPFEVSARSTTADFFPMFDVPFLYGRGWDKSADDTLEQVVVLGREINERLFGGEDSVGRTLTMNGEVFRVTGVIDDWTPIPKFYDVTTGPFDEVEEVYFPFSVSVAQEVGGDGNTNCWKPTDDAGWNSFLNSECVWMQFWVELHGADERSDYMTFLDAYVESQKQLGRFPRPIEQQAERRHGVDGGPGDSRGRRPGTARPCHPVSRRLSSEHDRTVAGQDHAPLRRHQFAARARRIAKRHILAIHR